jgi:hypothetical protein
VSARAAIALALATAAAATATATAAAAPLRLIGQATEAPTIFDERFAVYTPTEGVVRVWDERGPTYDRTPPAGCQRRKLHFPQLLYACPAADGGEQPVVLDVTSGLTQSPHIPPPDDSRPSHDVFYEAGRYWLSGLRVLNASGGAYQLSVQRYTGQRFELAGRVDLDSPTLDYSPPVGMPAPCRPLLTVKPSRRLILDNCDRDLTVTRCRPACSTMTAAARHGAFIEAGRVRVVRVADARVVASWPVPNGPRDKLTLALTDHHLFVNVRRTGGHWNIYRAAIGRPRR